MNGISHKPNTHLLHTRTQSDADSSVQTVTFNWNSQFCHNKNKKHRLLLHLYECVILNTELPWGRAGHNRESEKGVHTDEWHHYQPTPHTKVEWNGLSIEWGEHSSINIRRIPCKIYLWFIPPFPKCIHVGRSILLSMQSKSFGCCSFKQAITETHITNKKAKKRWTKNALNRKNTRGENSIAQNALRLIMNSNDSIVMSPHNKHTHSVALITSHHICLFYRCFVSHNFINEW